MDRWNWVLIIGGALLVLIEVALGGFAGFDLVLIGSAFIIGGGIGLWLGNPMLGFAIASALCVLYIALGRRYVRARMTPKHIRSNTEALMGVTGVVVLRIAQHAPGQARVRDEIWRAEPAPGVDGPFEPGAVITVAGVSGVTLQVR